MIGIRQNSNIEIGLIMDKRTGIVVPLSALYTKDCPSCGDFLALKERVFSVVFLDIQLPELNGIEIARRLRKSNKVSSIVFITSLAQYAQLGYEVDAISYLVKPVNYTTFSLVFKKAINWYCMNEECDMIIELPGGLYKISVDRLMYIEIVSHRLIFHLVDGTIEKTGTLNSIEEMLAPFSFLRCHNSIIVNPKFVNGVQQNEVKVGSETLQISRTRRKSFLEGLSKWYINKGGNNGLL